MSTLVIKSPKKQRVTRRPISGRRAKPFSPPKLLPEEIALESAILAAAARDVAELHR